MMHNIKKLKLFLYLIFIVSLVLCGQQASALVSTNAANFGDVYIGTTSTIPIYISNNDSEQSAVVTCSLEYGSNGFSIDSSSITLKPGETATVNVQFAPLYEGSVSDKITFASFLNNQLADPSMLPTPTIETVSLTGSGIKKQKEVSIESILEFFDESLADGSLSGAGPGRCSKNRLNALRNMIANAGKLIEMGNKEKAYEQLKVVLKRIDGTGYSKKKSSIFVTGDAVNELESQINAVMKSLDLSPPGCGRHFKQNHNLSHRRYAHGRKKGVR